MSKTEKAAPQSLSFVRHTARARDARGPARQSIDGRQSDGPCGRPPGPGGRTDAHNTAHNSRQLSLYLQCTMHGALAGWPGLLHPIAIGSSCTASPFLCLSGSLKFPFARAAALTFPVLALLPALLLPPGFRRPERLL